MPRLAAPLLLVRRTRYAGIARRPARLLLALLAILLVVALAGPAAIPAAPPVASDDTDVTLYSTIVENVRHGGDYYAVAADALRSGGYPLRPFVAFRLPTLAVIAAAVPAPVLTTMLWLLATMVALTAYLRLSPLLMRPLARAILLVLLFAGLAVASQPALALFHELWAGLFIALALLVRRPGRWIEAAAFALAATLIRETAAAVLVVMALLAWRDGDRREAAGWAVALGIALVVLGAHAHAVAQVVRESDLASPGWMGWHGIGFALTALARSTAAIALPGGLGAIAMLFGLFGWSALGDPAGDRIAAMLIVYVGVLATMARADNFYWALLAAPLSLGGLVFAVDGLRDLVAAALDTRRITVTRVVR